MMPAFDLVPLNLIVWAKTNAGMGGLHRSRPGDCCRCSRRSRSARQQRRTEQVRSLALKRLDLSWRLVPRLPSPPWPQGPYDGQADRHARGRARRPHQSQRHRRRPRSSAPGSTLIAADKTDRVCRGIELNPLYVDVIVRRYAAATGGQAGLVETGEGVRPTGQAQVRGSSAGLEWIWGPRPRQY